MGMVYPEPDSSWMKFAAKIRTKWNHYQEMEFAEAGMRGLFEQAYPDVTEAERYLLAFRQRAVLYPVEQKYVLKPMLAELGAERFLTLPDSFSFERCEYYRSYAEKFRKFSF